MSRSNPTNNSPNPCTRWFEWDGENGAVRYYDKSKPSGKTDAEGKPIMGCNVTVPDGFTFILLDELATIKGWHEASGSSIFANEVRDTRQDVFVVKAHKGGLLAEGLYAQIKDRVNNLGGNFTTNCYIAYKADVGPNVQALALGSVQFKGAALGTWMEFRKKNQAELYKKAAYIKGFTEGKKGRIIFRTPNFFLRDITDETNKQALAIDADLQTHLKAYLSRTKTQAAQPPPTAADHGQEPPAPEPPHSEPDPSEAEIPF